MNPFTVDWPPPMLRDLARIWTQARDRRAVTAAQAQIDARLARDPLDPAAYLSEALYRVHVPPLVVTYEVDEARRYVEITSVRYVP